MAGLTRSRRTALEVLTRVSHGELLDRALARSMAVGGLAPRDQAWVQELVYGTLRLRGRLDHLLRPFVRLGLPKLEPVVFDVLRLGAYQLLEMGGVPPYAAISQSVELVRSAGSPRAAGLVNAVLQALHRDALSVEFPAFEVDPVGHLVTWGSHPRWLVERWVERWGGEDTRRLIELNNQKPELYITPVGLAAEAAIDTLARGGVAAEPVAGFPESVRILPDHSPIEALAAVPAVVQDPAAAIVVQFADLPRGGRVLDLSAAPGGKTVALAAKADFVVAADLSPARLRRVQSNVERTAVSDRVGLVVADGRKPPFRQIDAVLLDAPCTGTGTLRRHPDGRWRITEHDLQLLAGLQRELLGASATLVQPGGLLIYSTCSLEPEENELQIEWFLERNPDFRLEAPAALIDGTMLRGAYLSILPQRYGVDGAFAARLRRSE